MNNKLKAIVGAGLATATIVALNTLGPDLYTPKIDSKVYNLAVKACKKACKKNDYLVVVDFSLSSTKKRMWIYDSNKKLVYQTFVTHGINSSVNSRYYPTSFSNTVGSKKSSLGVMRTGETYYGKHGLSLKLDGLEKWNSNVRKRSVVVHGATYIGEGLTGRSEGCLALPQKESSKIVNILKSGAVVVDYYPDKDWLKNSTYLKGN